MDPLSIVVSIDALLATAWTLARTTASIISAIKEAPAHIEAVKNDLTDFYSILGQLQGLVNEAESSSNTADGCLKTSTFEVLENSLRNSVTTFKDLKVLINEFNSQDLIKEVGKWKSPRWMFTESRMESLRKDLMSCKATLSTEISVLAWHKSNIINKTIDKIEANIQLYHQEEQLHRSQLADRLENLEAIRLHQSPSHTEADRAKIKFDPEYSLRHHLDSAAASIMSAPSSPSFVVSSLGEDKDSMVTSDHASFWTSLSRLSCDISPEEGFPNEFDRDQMDESQKIASTHHKIWSTSQITKTCRNEIYIQMHTGARLKVMVAADDTPRTVLSRLKDLDGFWSYWSEKGFFTYACKPVDPEEQLEQFLGSTTPTFWFRTGHPIFSGLQENQAPRSEPAIPEVPKIVQHQRRNKPIIRSKQSLIRQIYRQSTLGVR